ncbi:DNA-dependent metalloprotease WSS1 [Lactuca sativa]|uniref:WLM domain-containing protein n=1 Tax=Lactuca sativa TaxID=4236 RepID=A0A9R1XV22_LACSA|nr:DNA-dependent metalloprotease WSS1 [Lactuca sativa]XP_023764997.1 DNA-dependent metalloprotease WSS1 [Lactuca sativa]KAJ0226911.1 hypothetical protein LSAT_V11C100010960 [Lactuca sativa]
MNVNDLHKVWEIRTLKRKVGGDEAKRFLEKIAKQVQPIMHKHKWRVKVLSEMCPKNPQLLGLNVGHGLHVKLRLRKPNTDWDFYPFDHVLDTMLHELCHNAIGPHNAGFYKLWDELRKECEELMSKGISGSGDGFDLPGRRLGGFSHQPPLSSLRRTALAAAENRARQGPSGPKRVGGDKSIMSALTPTQAAAMAAERRLQDDIWCGLEEIVEEEESRAQVQHAQNVTSSSSDKTNQKRGPHSESCFVDLTSSPTSNKRSRHEFDDLERTCIDLTSSASASTGGCDNDIHESSSGWECMMCTLLNPVLAPVCELCGTHKPKSVEDKYKTWSCKFCTLENNVKLEKCGACGQWRYSYGQPIATPSPNVGT